MLKSVLAMQLRLALGLALGTACLLTYSPTSASAQSAADDIATDDYGPLRPLVVFSVSGVEDSLDDIRAMFATAGREDMSDLLEGFLAANLRDLKGFDREKPIGFMLFLDAAQLPPRPVPVGCVPVDDIDELIKLVELGPITPKKREGTENRYELVGNRRTLHALIQDGYALVTRSETLLDDGVMSPVDAFAPVSGRYDVGLSVMLTSIPPVLRDVFLATMRSNAEAELQQRDDESEAAYSIRRANGMSALEFFDLLIRGGDSITLGLQADREQNSATLELMVQALPDSDLSTYLKEFSGQQSEFAPLETPDAPLSLNVSWKLDAREKKALRESLEGLELAAQERFVAVGKETIKDLFSPLIATVEAGHLNACIQFASPDGEEFALTGAVKIVGGETFARGLDGLLHEAESLENVDSVTLNAANHRNVALHRLRATNASEEDLRMYGGHPDLYIGASSRTLWFGLGGADALPTLTASIDRLADATPEERARSTAPVQIVFRMAPWLRLPPKDDEDLVRRDLATMAMEEGADAVRIDVRPNEHGVRVRAQFDSGFVQLLALLIAHQYDMSQF